MVKARILMILSLIVALVVPSSSIAIDSGADAIMGVWVTEGGKAQVEITREQNSYQGRIVWLKEPVYPGDDSQGMAGQPKVDRENPDKAQRARPIIGLIMVAGFSYAGNSVWSDGSIYDPESGKTYRCKMSLMPDGSLKVRGYIGISLFGRTTVWTRAPAASHETPST